MGSVDSIDRYLLDIFYLVYGLSAFKNFPIEHRKRREFFSLVFCKIFQKEILCKCFVEQFRCSLFSNICDGYYRYNTRVYHAHDKNRRETNYGDYNYYYDVVASLYRCIQLDSAARTKRCRNQIY